ncbi:MAG: asparaginase [Limimaricola sp.]|uniref:asparaginase n=1 Tax=Limimaricola sp. TaxID=2211665 RepID=UPI001D74F31D|nr:asparaginase [Limimaricola sp.]MBI1418839.1 asparaginase [Limimaricola sp.]
MADAVNMIEVWRGDMVECTHRGHAVICDGAGEIVTAWGDPTTLIYPRSSCKMLQALPLVESGAADSAGLRTDQLALSCASHIGAAYHTDRVAAWLADLGLGDDDFRCGTQEPSDRAARDALIRAGQAPCQIHNNCSGKHSGFLTLNRHLRGGPEYVDPAHPVQVAVRAAFEEVTGEDSPGYGIDGCSAPNFATSVHGLARAMASFATAGDRSGARASAQARLVAAMTQHPELVSGEGRACTELMRATGGAVAIKGGADGVYVAIWPARQLGIALKIVDGGEEAKESAIAALLVHLGAVAADHPAVLRRLGGPILNRRRIPVGRVATAPGFV